MHGWAESFVVVSTPSMAASKSPMASPMEIVQPRVSFAGKSSMVRSWVDSQNYSSP